MYFYTLLNAITVMCLYKLQIQIHLCSVGIWFTREREKEDKDIISMIWVRENGWKKSSFSPQPY